MGAIKGVDWMMLEVPDASLLLGYIPNTTYRLIYSIRIYWPLLRNNC